MMNHNKIGIADYGMNVYYGGMLDYDTRMEQIKAIGYDGLERMEPLNEADLIHKMTTLARLGMDFGTVRCSKIDLNIQGTAAGGRKYIWVNSPDSRDGLETLCRQANILAKTCAKYGIKCGIHNHLGTPVQTQEELETFLEKCPEVGIVYDVGHMAVAGGDVVKIAQTYADRVLAVHFKEWCYTTDARDIPWYEQGYFTGLGQGTFAVDNHGVANALLERGYTGWFYIEQDTHHREPLTDLEQSRNVMRSWGL